MIWASVNRVFFIGISSFILPRKFYFHIPLRSGGITILIVDDPLAARAEAFPQPQHRFEPGDRPTRRLEGLESADFGHVLLHAEVVTLYAFLVMLGDIGGCSGWG